MRRSKGKRYLRKKRTFRRSKKTPLVKKIQSVSRRTALKLIETKKDVVLNEVYNTFTGSVNYYYSWVNCFSQIAYNSTFQNGLIGDAFQDPLCVFKIQWIVNTEQLRTYNGDNSLRPIWIHAWILSINDQLSNALSTPNTYNNTSQNWFTQPNGPNATMNGDNVRVLRHWCHQVNYPSLLATGTTDRTVTSNIGGRKKMMYKWKGTKRFEEDPGSNANNNPAIRPTLKGNNYYFMLGWCYQNGVNGPVSNANTAVDLRVDRYIYYKDA